jgi:hypothetical protein
MYENDCTTASSDGQMSGTNYYMNLAFVIASFLVPWALLMVPLIALTMQVSLLLTLKGHFPNFKRLNQPFKRSVWQKRSQGCNVLPPLIYFKV